MWKCPRCGREFRNNNQAHYCGAAPVTVEEYIERQDEAVQAYLMELHGLICAAVPGIKQSIAWSMPSYGEKSASIQFAAFKKHVSLYVGADAIAQFEAELKPYECKKAAVYFKYAEPLPAELIANLTRWCCL